MNRAGKKQLLEIVEACGERRRQITELVGDFRLLSGEQIRRAYFTTGPSDASNRRHARRELQWLADNRFLHKLDRRIGGSRGGSDSTIYALGAIGQRAIEFWQGHGLARPSSSWEPGAPFVAHTLAVAELYVELRERQRSGALELVRWDNEPGCWRSYLGPFGDQRQLRPDAFVVVADETFEYSWFIEVDRGTERARTIRRKISQYVDHANASGARALEDAFPHVLWIAPDAGRAKWLEALSTTAGGFCKFAAVTPAGAATALLGGGQ